MKSEADERFVLFLIESLLRSLLFWVTMSYLYQILLELIMFSAYLVWNLGYLIDIL